MVKIYRSISGPLSSRASLPSASSSSPGITSPEEDLPKAAAVAQQTKALISRKPLPLPVVSGRGEERGKSDSAPRLLSSLCRLRDKWRDKAQGEIIFRAGPISRAIEERKWGMSLGGLGGSHEGSGLYCYWQRAPRRGFMRKRGGTAAPPPAAAFKAPARCSSTSLLKTNQMGLLMRREHAKRKHACERKHK